VKSGRPPVSYIVPAFNCALFLSAAVESIFEGNLEAGDEVVIVDDCSTDETPEVIAAIGSRHESVQAIRHRENRGTAAASRNTGISCARHDLIFCLDSDNLLLPGSMPGLIAHMAASGADAAAFGELHYFQTSPADVSHKWIFRAEVTLADAMAGVVWPGPSGNYMFSRESWLRAGRYPEPYLENRSLDSWAFAIRQLGTGSRMVTLPSTWYYHRYGHDSHYVQNWRRGNQSLAALAGLMPLLDQFETKDVEYLFSANGRNTWFDHLAERPIRVRRLPRGQNGAVELPRPGPRRRLSGALASVGRAVEGWIGRRLR
jgi:glycosyltransferase involved in cell wall biosynthesis